MAAQNQPEWRYGYFADRGHASIAFGGILLPQKDHFKLAR